SIRIHRFCFGLSRVANRPDGINASLSINLCPIRVFIWGKFQEHMKLKIIYFCLIIPVALISCRNEVTQSTTKEEVNTKYCLSEQLKQTTDITPIRLLPIQETLTLSGKVEYDENDLLAFHSLLEGTAEMVNFELGDY